MSCEMLSQLYNANLLRTEMEIEYIFNPGPITDYSMQIGDQQIGVSVTRAMRGACSASARHLRAVAYCNQKLLMKSKGLTRCQRRRLAKAKAHSAAVDTSNKTSTNANVTNITPGEDYLVEDARRLLHKKLIGCINSTQNVVRRQRWQKQILHIFCETPYIADQLMTAWQEMKEHDPDTTGNTLVLATIVEDADWIFHENKH